MSAPAADPRVAAVQMCSGAEVAANLQAAGALLERARVQGAVVAVLPENFAFMGVHERDKLAVAEPAGRGQIQDFLADAARRHELWIVAGTIPLATKERDRVAAACLVYEPSGAAVARYDKIHLFDVAVPDGGSYKESASIAPGAPAPVVVPTPAGRIGLSVCYDLRFPELFRQLVAQGAEVLAVPSAFTERTGEAHWEPLLRARAIENQCYVVAPGQHGAHPNGRRTWGHSLIVDPWGRVLAQQPAGEGVIVAPLPREPLLALRRSFPALTHRRL
ncbi:MAG: carbon-nitrogen hydrolase family protein [Gammaproteobacteria bacterium]